MGTNSAIVKRFIAHTNIWGYIGLGAKYKVVSLQSFPMSYVLVTSYLQFHETCGVENMPHPCCLLG